jgi:hypothetical protein
MEDMEAWISENWFNLLSSAGIVGSLIFNAISLRSQTKTQRIANLLIITQNHRELWKEFFKRPELARVLDDSPDLPKYHITRDEEIFVNLVILQTNSVYYATKDELTIKLEGLRRDVWWFFSLPIPRIIWEKSKVLQNDDFVAFVESCRNWK